MKKHAGAYLGRDNLENSLASVRLCGGDGSRGGGDGSSEAVRSRFGPGLGLG